MNTLSHGLTQSALNNFIVDVEVYNLYQAMENAKITIPMISSCEDLYSFLVEHLEWSVLSLVLRLVGEYRTTGNYPDFGFDRSQI
jgi:hypothetical protein